MYAIVVNAPPPESSFTFQQLVVVDMKLESSSKIQLLKTGYYPWLS